MFPSCPEVKKEKMKAGELWSGSVRFGSVRVGSGPRVVERLERFYNLHAASNSCRC